MNYTKTAGAFSAAIRSGIKTIIQEETEAAIKGGAKASVKTVYNRIKKEVGEEAAVHWARGNIKAWAKSPISFITKALNTSKHNNILKFFSMTDDKALKTLLSDDVVMEMDDVVKNAIKRSAKTPKDAKLLEVYIKERGGARNFLKESVNPAIKSDVKSAPAVKNLLKDNGADKMVKNIDDDLSKYFIKNPTVLERLSAKSIGTKLKWGAGKAAMGIVGISTLYSTVIWMWDFIFEKTPVVTTAIGNVVSEMRDLITEGATTNAQSPQLMVNIRKAMGQLNRLNRELASVSMSSKPIRARSQDQVPGIAGYYKNKFEKARPNVKKTAEEIEFVFNNIATYLDEYDAKWMESVTALGIGGSSANRAKQVLTSIEHARKVLNEFVLAFDTTEEKINSVEEEMAAANIEDPKKEGSATQKLFRIAQEMEKKNSELDETDKLYSELAAKEVKEDPGFIMEQVKKIAPEAVKDIAAKGELAVGKAVLAVLPRSVVTSPTKLNFWFSLLDTALLAQQVAIPVKIVQFLASKGVPAAMSAVGKGATTVGATAISAAVEAPAVAITTAFMALDIGHSLGKWAFSGDNLMDETSQLINYLEQSEGIKGTEWSKINRRLQTKLSGSAYIIEKGMAELKENQFTEKRLTDANMQKFENTLRGIQKVSQGITNIKEVTNILKQNQTRDLYIKHGEGVMGAAGRGVDVAVNFVATFGGLLGSREVGENPTGFANIYNAMMDFVNEIDSMILVIQEGMIPYKTNLEQFRSLLKDVQPFIANTAEQIKAGKL